MRTAKPQDRGQLTLVLARTHYAGGTNGTLSLGQTVICHTIELPWRENRRNVSCIPAGRYRVVRSHSPKFGKCLRLVEVRDRDGILIHAANDAAKELQGCIAPVTVHTGEGRGLYSRIALERMLTLLDPVFYAKEPVWLTINSSHHVSEN